MKAWFHQYRYFLAVTVTIFILLRLPSLFEPYWYGDEGVYLVLGQGIRRGLTLYRQIHDNKPPTLYYLAAIAQTVSGFRLLLALWLIPTVIAFHRLTSLLLKKDSPLATIIFLILTSIPLLEGNIANAEIFMLLPTIFGIYLGLTAKNNRSFFLSGLSLGFAFTFKVPVFIEFVFLGLWLLVTSKPLLSRIKPLSLFALGFATPIFLWFIYFILKSSASDFLFAALLQNFGYLSSWVTGSHSGSVSQGGLLARGILLLFGWTGVYFLSIKKIIKSNETFVFGWFFATLFGVLLSSRPYPHYLIQIIPPLILSLIFFIRRRLIFVFPFVIFALALVKYHFYFYDPISYYANFYSYALKLKPQTKYLEYFGKNVPIIYQVSDYIRTHSQVNDKIFIWGDEPYVYALTKRLPASKYTVAYHIVDFRAYDQTIDQIKTNLPEFILFYPMTGKSYQSLSRLVDRYYAPDNQIGQVIIYKLR